MEKLKDVKIVLEFSPYEVELMFSGLNTLAMPAPVRKIFCSVMDKLDEARKPFLGDMMKEVQENVAKQKGNNLAVH